MTNREFFNQVSTSEYPKFVSVLKAAPDGRLDYRPHPKSRSGHELIGHLIAHEQDLVELLETGTINHRMDVPFEKVDEAVSIFEDAHSAASSLLSTLDDASWEEMGQFIVQGNVIMQAPRRDLAWMVIFDAIHHRGQLSTYLRPMGGTVPAIYGPSADTMIVRAQG